MLTTSQKGLDFIKSFEHLELEAYQDMVGIWTIGYGHTDGVTSGQTITEDQADTMFYDDVAAFEQEVNSVVKVKLTQGQFDALVSFTFNLGFGRLQGSTLLRRVNAKLFSAAANEFPRWCRAGGNVVAGLLRRRNAEKAMFIS